MDIKTFNHELKVILRNISINRIQSINKVLEPFGMSHTQCMILLSFHGTGQLCVSEIGRHTQMPISNISAICKRLEQNGYLIRERSSEDERIVNIKMTPKGVQLAHDLHRTIDIEQERFTSAIPEDDRDEIIVALKKLDNIKTL